MKKTERDDAVFVVRPDCACLRDTCVLRTGKLDEECVEKVWLPNRYHNLIGKEYKTRKTAIVAFLKDFGVHIN